jgi:hypothetical protein
MKTIRLLALPLLLLVTTSSAHAFKPAPPPKVMRFVDRQTKTKPTLVIRNKGYRPTSYVVRAGDWRYRWKQIPALPATVRVAGLVHRVILLGGYGDGCSDLGKIAIYTLKGKLKATIDLTKQLPALQKTSRAYTRICCPCRWLHKITLSFDHKLLELNVCNKHHVRIEVQSGKVKVADRPFDDGRMMPF